MPRQVEPRFRTQGSWSYLTCIQPFLMPPQEMDWDFGVYLPVDVWEENGPPHTMAKAYFALVERLLADLCHAEGWTLKSGKKTCIRVQITAWAHIDVPLYAAPAHQFVHIRERIAKASLSASVHDSVALEESVELGELPEQAWEDMDDVVMACRTGEWLKSDPEKVALWFNDRCAALGDQLRRVCRYVKAWRDKNWVEGAGPTSVQLMIAIAQRFEANAGRDDLAFEQAMSILSDALARDTRERGIDEGAEDFNRLKGSQRQEAALRARATLEAMQRARNLGGLEKDDAIAIVRAELGDRIPDDTQLIAIETSSAERVLATAPSRVTPPVVRATSAGRR